MSAGRAPVSPYKGLSAFDDSELDALLFFGRERETEIVVANLIASRLTVLYGPSGVGKSSLLRAAVARSLRQLPEEPLVVVFSQWSADPAVALSELVARAAGVESGTMLSVIESAQTGRDVYLVLDQAEEYFLYHADDAGPSSFAEFLPSVLAAPLRVNALVSLREDSLAKLDRFTGRISGVFANTLRLDRLDRGSARAAILKPVERYSELTGHVVDVEPALVDSVLDEVGAGRIEPALGGLGAVDGGGESARVEAPYLQLVLQRLWEEERAAGSDTLRRDTLARLGGAGKIVDEHLQGALDQLTPVQKDVAARIFNHLVTPSGTKIAHEAADLADFGGVSGDELRPVVAELTDRRILRSLDDRGDVRYEIFHDVLAQPILAWRARHRTEREVERELEDERRRRSRFQRLLALGTLALAVAAVVVGFALVERRNAADRERDAQARELDATAVALLPEDPELSLLLARESARMSPGPTAEDALLQSLLRSRVRRVHATGVPVEAVAVSPVGEGVGVVAAGTASLFDVRGTELRTWDVGPGGGVSFSGDGAVVLAHGSGSAVVRDATTGEVVCALAGGRPQADAVLAGSLAVSVRNGAGTVWDVRTCSPTHKIGRVGTTAVSVVASPAGNRVAFLSGRDATVVDPALGRVVHRLRHRGDITSLAFTADGSTIVTGGRDQVARIWSGASGRMRHELDGHSGQVLDVAIDATGTQVVTASTDGTARIWDVDTGQLAAPHLGHTNYVRAVDFSADGRFVVTASDDGSAGVWGVNGARLAALAGHDGPVLDARFTADGRSVVTAGEDGTVRLWDAATRPDIVASERGAPEPPAKTAVSPDGTTSARIDGDVVRLERGGETILLEGHQRPVSSVAFSPDGGRLVTASRDNDVRLWDVATGASLRVLRGHFRAVNDARFSPDGRWIVSAGPRSVGLWRASDARLVDLLFGPPGPFTTATFADDSRTIVVVSASGVGEYRCQVCGEIPELLELADERLAGTARELTAEERELYVD